MEQHLLHDDETVPTVEIDSDVDLIGTLPPYKMDFGEGRYYNMQYYQYCENFRSRQQSLFTNEFGEGFVNIDFDENKSKANKNKQSFSWHRLWAFTGPGWLMSIAYIDPGNLEADLQSGAVAGYQLIWVLWWSTVLGWFIQTLSARLGVVTGRNLAQMCRSEYNKPLTLLLWIMTELAIIGSDIQEVIGSAIAFQVLFKWPLWIGCAITALDAFMFLLLSKLGIIFLDRIFVSFIFVMAVTFAIEFGIGKPDLLQILKGWGLPVCDENNMEQAVAMIGAVIMPHNLFLHSALIQARNLQRYNINAVKEANYYFTIEGGMSLLVSFFINLFIVSVFAKGFYNTSESRNFGLHDAGDALGARFGELAKYVWAIGLLAAGQASTMTGTMAGQYAMAGFLELNWTPWKRTLLTRCFALGPSLIVVISAQKYLDKMEEWINVQQSIQLPFALLPLLFFNCNIRVMGKQFVLKKKWQFFFWIITFMLIAINIYLVAIFFGNINIEIMILFLLFYLGLIGYIITDFYLQHKRDFLSNCQPIIIDTEESNELKYRKVEKDAVSINNDMINSKNDVYKNASR
eukprot:286856_1